MQMHFRVTEINTLAENETRPTAGENHEQQHGEGGKSRSRNRRGRGGRNRGGKKHSPNNQNEALMTEGLADDMSEETDVPAMEETETVSADASSESCDASNRENRQKRNRGRRGGKNRRG